MGEEPANVYWPWPCSSGDCWSGRERDLGLANPSMLSIVDKNMVYQSIGLKSFHKNTIKVCKWQSCVSMERLA